MSLKMKALITAVIVISIGSIIFMVLAQIATNEDFRGESVVHTRCEVMDKIHHSGGRGPSYRIESTCGEWFTQAVTYNCVQIGGKYDLQTTKGNWAHTPHLTGISNFPACEYHHKW